MPPLQNPIPVPGESEAFVKVVASERVLATDCIPSDHLAPRVLEPGYYDAYDQICIRDRLVKVMQRFTVHCFGTALHYRPNASVECGPQAMYLGSRVMMQVYGEKALQVRKFPVFIALHRSELLIIIAHAEIETNNRGGHSKRIPTNIHVQKAMPFLGIFQQCQF